MGEYVYKYDWPRKKRNNITAKVPYAYMIDPEDNAYIIPDPSIVPAIEKALGYMNEGHAMRKVAEWLSVAVGKEITAQGLLYTWEQKCGSDKSNPRVKERRAKKRKNAPKTPEEAQERELKRKIGAAKMRQTVAQKKLTALEAEIQAKLEAATQEPEETYYPPFNPIDTVVLPTEYENREIAFTPNFGPQTDFLAANEREVLYGGAAGGGKSYALLADCLRYFDNPNFRGIILRRTTDELRELIWKSDELYKKIYPTARWSEKRSAWKFPSGAELWLTYLERDEDVRRYQGQTFCYIAVDELTQYATPFAWNYLRSRLRTTDPTLPLYMRACVDEGDVLTENGWKPIQEVKVGENVYGCLPNGQMVLRPVHTTAIYPIDEDIVRIKKKTLYMSMTEDHRVVQYPQGNYNKNKDSKIVRWNEIKNKTCVALVRTSSKFDTDTEYNTPVGAWSNLQFASFLGWYVAEGSGGNKDYRVTITQLKKKNHEEIMELMNASGQKTCYSKKGDFQFKSKAIHAWLKPLGKAKDKHFPREFLNTASKEQLEAAFSSYMKGDGTVGSSTLSKAVTTSTLLKDNLLEIATKLGLKAQAHLTKSINPNHNDRWDVYFNSRNNYSVVRHDKKDVHKEHYTGNVYCIGVEGIENFFIKQKDFVWLSGNTTNPGGVGHGWVKKMFIDPAPANTPFNAIDIEKGTVLVYPDDYHDKKMRGKPLFKRRFIPARLSDNPYLFKGGEYETNLLSLPEAERRKLLDGDWNVIEGAAFPEFNSNTHVIKPYKIPKSWRRFRSCDYGYNSFSAVHWYAIDPIYETLIVYRELYVTKMTGRELAQEIKRIELLNDDHMMYGVLDSSVWHQRGQTGPSIAEEMISEGVQWRPGDRSKGSRANGKNRLHELLKVEKYNDTNIVPGIMFFDTCRQIIADLQVIPADPDGKEDIDERYPSDHAYDSIRYGIMSRPRGQSPWDFENTRIVPSHRPADAMFGY